MHWHYNLLTFYLRNKTRFLPPTKRIPRLENAFFPSPPPLFFVFNWNNLREITINAYFWSSEELYRLLLLPLFFIAFLDLCDLLSSSTNREFLLSKRFFSCSSWYQKSTSIWILSVSSIFAILLSSRVESIHLVEEFLFLDIFLFFSFRLQLEPSNAPLIGIIHRFSY